MPSVATGAALSKTSRTRLHFRAGVGLDWLHRSGASAAARVDAHEDLETSAALLAGWSGPGLTEGRGAPIGLSAGPALRVDRGGAIAAGGRWQLALGLWYRRAAIEFDVSVWRPLGRARERDMEITFGLVLRLAPWRPSRR